MSEYRHLLDRESERFDLPAGALDRMLARRRRKERNQRVGAAIAALVIFGVGAWAAVSLLGAGQPQPVSVPTPGIEQPFYSQIAGTYTVTLTDADPGVAVNHLAGTYTMRLLPDGTLLLSVPSGFGREGPSPSGIAYRLSGSRFTTNAFVNLTCPGSVATYRWQRTAKQLVFAPLQEDCGVRRILFSSRPWNLGA